jgi:alkylated DNA repair dioxygenase AlkB
MRFSPTHHQLDEHCAFLTGTLPQELQLSEQEFEDLWHLHPAEFHEIKMHGRLVKTPRWQQAYGMDYHYTGRTNQALPVPSPLEPLLAWVKEQIDIRLNGLLLNWYDGTQGHYIGKHRDSRVNMIEGAPIVTISFGEERIFRLRPWGKPGQMDFRTTHGSLFIMPYETNLAWTHEVPHFRKYTGRRISVTFRAFSAGDEQP